MAANATKEQLFAEVASAHGGMISRIALSYETDPLLRRDLIQDILMAIWAALPLDFDRERSIGAFAASIAQKRGISHAIRRSPEPRKVERAADYPTGSLLGDEIALGDDRRRHLINSVRVLPIPQREAVVLSFEGFTYAEIADILGISAEAATLRCRRGRAALMTVMERCS